MVASILDYLEWSAEQYPDGEAYEDGNETATFSEMRERAKGIGTAFLRKGISHGPVSVYMKKSVAMVSAFFGITACGCSYCPVGYSDARRAAAYGFGYFKALCHCDDRGI